MVVVVFCLLMAVPVRAVPPPDFIINVGTQVMQFFSLALLFLTAIFSSVYQFLRLRFSSVRLKTGYWVGAMILILVVSAVGAKVFGVVLEKRAFARLALTPETKQVLLLPDTPLSEGASDVERILAPSVIFPETPVLVPDASATTSTTEDRVAQFIQRYYGLIATHDLRGAYDLSKKTVSYDTFASWYATTKSITITKLQRIDATHSSLELMLDEATGRSRYAIAMTVELDPRGVPVRVAASSARFLGEAGSSAVVAASTASTATMMTLPFKLTNDRLRSILRDPRARFLVLDAREDIENEYGHFPGSIHIRYADLKAGRWVELPTDRPVIVLCWSGIRGSQVASFLRTKKLAASYLAEGANGWVAAGGVWEGSIRFADRFPESRYRIAFSKEEMFRRVQGGAVLIDAREPAGRARRPLENAQPISLLSTPSLELPGLFDRIPDGKPVITVCSEYVDCFEAKLVGVEAERRGHPFLGRYVY